MGSISQFQPRLALDREMIVPLGSCVGGCGLHGWSLDSPGMSWGPQWDRLCVSAEPGIPTGESFHRSRLSFSEDEGKGWAAAGWGSLKERDHNAAEFPQAAPTSLSHCCHKSTPFSGVKTDSVEPRPQPRAGEGMWLKPRACFSTLYRPCPCTECRGRS